MTVVISRGPRADEGVKKLVKKLKKGFVIPPVGRDDKFLLEGD